MSKRALVREVSAGFASAIVREARPEPVDVELAGAQHGRYVAALVAAGLEVTRLPSDPALPDCCFVEDMAIVAGDHAVLTRCAAPSRQPEQPAVAAALARHLELLTLPEGCHVDGGDVLRLGRMFFVGMTDRTTRAGFEAFAAAVGGVGFDARAVAVEGALHLKCHATALAEDRVAVTRGFLPGALFDGIADVVWLPPEEAYAANVLPLGNGKVLIAAGYPRTREALTTAGFDPLPLETTEFAAADGSLTCLSILFTS